MFILGFVTRSVGQVSGPVPKLKELDYSNMIGKQATEITEEQTVLLKRLTRTLMSTCAADPDPGDPKTAEAVFKTFRIGQILNAPQGDPALIVRGLPHACAGWLATALFF